MKVFYRKDGINPKYAWSYSISRNGQSYWLSFGYKSKRAAMRDYAKHHRQNGKKRT